VGRTLLRAGAPRPEHPAEVGAVDDTVAERVAESESLAVAEAEPELDPEADPEAEWEPDSVAELDAELVDVAVGEELVKRFDEGESLKVKVLTIMGKDLVVEVNTDTDA
jgi:hypothetical protein